MLSIKEILQLTFGKSNKLVDFENTMITDHPDQLKIRFKEFDTVKSTEKKSPSWFSRLFHSTDVKSSSDVWENRFKD